MSAQAPAASAAEIDAAPKNKKKKLLWIVLAVVLLGAGGGGAWWWRAQAAPGAKAEETKKLPTQYLALDPSFVVNLSDGDASRYLQADVQLATRDPETLKALQEQSPAIRNRLLLLFGAQTQDQIAQRSGKERLQEKALVEVRATLKKEGVPDKVDAVIFTSIVTQ